MHPYSTDSEERNKVPLLLGGIAALLAWALHVFLVCLESYFPWWNVPWWFDMPSLVGFYGLLLRLFDRRLWKIPLMARLNLVNTPNLEGTWPGELRSSHDGFSTPHRATLSVNQTWQRIQIRLETETSASVSRSASMTTLVPDNIHVTYEYWNEPSADAPATMHAFRGTATHIFRLRGGEQTFDGDYYTGRDRQTYGTLTLRRNSTPPKG